MIVELEGIWKEVVVAQLMYYSGICLEGLGKTNKNSNPELHLIFRLTCSVIILGWTIILKCILEKQGLKN
jgi:hypothetical protein